MKLVLIFPSLLVPVESELEVAVWRVPGGFAACFDACRFCIFEDVCCKCCKDTGQIVAARFVEAGKLVATWRITDPQAYDVLGAGYDFYRGLYENPAKGFYALKEFAPAKLLNDRIFL